MGCLFLFRFFQFLSEIVQNFNFWQVLWNFCTHFLEKFFWNVKNSRRYFKILCKTSGKKVSFWHFLGPKIGPLLRPLIFSFWFLAIQIGCKFSGLEKKGPKNGSKNGSIFGPPKILLHRVNAYKFLKRNFKMCKIPGLEKPSFWTHFWTEIDKSDIFTGRRWLKMGFFGFGRDPKNWPFSDPQKTPKWPFWPFLQDQK